MAGSFAIETRAEVQKLDPERLLIAGSSASAVTPFCLQKRRRGAFYHPV